MKVCGICKKPIPKGTKCHTSIKGTCYITVERRIKGWKVTFLKEA